MGKKGVRETGRPFSFQSGCDAELTAALNLGVTKVLAPDLARRYRNQSEFSGACGDDEPLAGPSLWPADAGEEPRLCPDRRPDTCVGHRRNDCDLGEHRYRQNKSKDAKSAANVQPSQCVGGNRSDQQTEQCGETGHHQGIEQITMKAFCDEDVDEVIE